ncbi:DUF3558 domain-containing protein [Actinopolyspora erythraea]|uniref:DUF3558 domain-containing protein n=1 Tax=Actinopolyspora erythraea TaxID=414996 RepID=A0A099DAF6_9ACTN|nr:DUF3558 family protein [Actinopolyspora erythraea]ASU77147.1 DUF3558 domain-containing protein [Actinopolyspora erythraea]KGI83158.1 hypothetical protein IL38_00555 [Actinopolyspora erythraea]
MRNPAACGIAVLASLLLVGCGGPAAEEPPASDTATRTGHPTSDNTSSPLPERTALAKAFQLAEVCDIVPENRWRALGANQPPESRDSNGNRVCQYQKGKAGEAGSWSVSLGKNRARGLNESIQAHPEGEPLTIAGYPAYKSETSVGCLYYVDVSDEASLVVSGVSSISDDGTIPTKCGLFKKFAAAAVENLPNA